MTRSCRYRIGLSAGMIPANTENLASGTVIGAAFKPLLANSLYVGLTALPVTEAPPTLTHKINKIAARADSARLSLARQRF